MTRNWLTPELRAEGVLVGVQLQKKVTFFCSLSLSF